MVRLLVGEICINFSPELKMLMLSVVRLVCGPKSVIKSVKIRKFG
jgi:hypothetical protein